MAKDNMGNSGELKVAGQRKKPVRKVYDHVLAEREKFVLQEVQRAQAALKNINFAIREGKTIRPQLVGLCTEITRMAADILFSDPQNGSQV